MAQQPPTEEPTKTVELSSLVWDYIISTQKTLENLTQLAAQLNIITQYGIRLVNGNNTNPDGPPPEPAAI